MASVVRVELHNYASEQHYRELHALLGGAGFGRTIDASDGKRYCLPPGLYWYPYAKSAAEVRDLAHSFASKTGCLNSVFAAEATGASAWIGLKEVQPPSTTSQLFQNL